MPGNGFRRRKVSVGQGRLREVMDRNAIPGLLGAGDGQFVGQEGIVTIYTWEET